MHLTGLIELQAFVSFLDLLTSTSEHLVFHTEYGWDDLGDCILLISLRRVLQQEDLR